MKKVLRSRHDIPSVAALLNVPEQILTEWVEEATNSSAQTTEQVQINAIKAEMKTLLDDVALLKRKINK
ncbi:hypothetical protein P4S73_25050 [Paraglaciecola sp. Hal342]